MQLTLNEEPLEIADKITISEFIIWLKEQERVEQDNFAVAVNMEFVPRSLYSETVLQADDQVEIVFPMQGG